MVGCALQDSCSIIWNFQRTGMEIRWNPNLHLRAYIYMASHL
jgi:hypothetical protein